MGKAATFGFSLMLRTSEEVKRAERLVQKDRGRFEIIKKADGLFFYYLPKGRIGSQEHYNNGLKISKWVVYGRGAEPN